METTVEEAKPCPELPSPPLEELTMAKKNDLPPTDEENTTEERTFISAAEIAQNLAEGRHAEKAAQEWLPETAPALPINQTIESATPSADPMVTIISDPFQITTLDIQSEQIDFERDLDLEIDEDLEPLELNEDEEEATAQLERLAVAVAEQDATHALEINEAQLTQEEAEATAARLAREIAEDVALAQAMSENAEPSAEEDEEAAAAIRAAMPKHPEMLADGSLDLAELQSCVEALLFMSEKSLSNKKLKELLGPEIPLEHFDEAIALLQQRYQHPCHGFELLEVAGGFQFRTKPGRAALARKLAKVQTQRLSSGAMETLAIVSYKQPVLKEDVDQIRGVDSSHFIRTLLDRKLIKISGRSELPGRPMMYGTTDEFLELFALKDLQAMPPLRELEAMIPSSESQNPEDEDPRVTQMRKMVSEMNSDTSVNLIYDPKQDDEFLTDIREKVKAIPISTAYLDEQKAAEFAAKEAKQASKDADAIIPPEGLEGFASPAPETPVS